MRLAVSQPTSAMSEETLIERITSHFEATFEEVRGRSRVGRIAEARAMVAVALHGRGESFASIGRRLDGRDRATIRDLFATGEKMMADRPQLRAVVGVA